MVLLHPGYFFLYISYLWVILFLVCRYIQIFINMFMNVIYMFTAICWCTSYNIILGCTPFWEDCYAYFLYIIFNAIVATLIDLHSKKLINISLFELFVTCIETHISVPILSISHLFISIIKCFFGFLLLGQIFTLNLQHSKTCSKHHLYTIFNKISSFYASSLATRWSNVWH